MTDAADSLVTDLRTIRTSWPDMLNLTSDAAGGSGEGDPAKPPIPAHVLSVRRETAEVLASWARLVAEERDLHPSLDTKDAHAVAGFLVTHADWLATHESGEAAGDEIHRWAGQCADIVERNRTRRYQVGRCPEMICDDDGTELAQCAGNLWALIRETDSLLPRNVVCDGPEQHEWSPWQWHALGKRLGTSTLEEAS